MYPLNRSKWWSHKNISNYNRLYHYWSYLYTFTVFICVDSWCRRYNGKSNLKKKMLIEEKHYWETQNVIIWLSCHTAFILHCNRWIWCISWLSIMTPLQPQASMNNNCDALLQTSRCIAQKLWLGWNRRNHSLCTNAPKI